MPKVTQSEDAMVVGRPLLTMKKGDIAALCKRFSIPFFHNSSNDDVHTGMRNWMRRTL